MLYHPQQDTEMKIYKHFFKDAFFTSMLRKVKMQCSSSFKYFFIHFFVPAGTHAIIKVKLCSAAFGGKPRKWSSRSTESISIHERGLPDSIFTNTYAVLVQSK